jgi:nucleotide-binding universal stress UspA family protein
MKAVEAAARLAEGYGQVLVIAHGYRNRKVEYRCTDLSAVPTEMRWQLTPGAVGEEIVERAVNYARAVTNDSIEVRGRSVAGDPARILLGLSRELQAATIVIGNIGLHGLGHRLSVPHKIARKARCAVVMVDTEEWARRGEPVGLPTPLTMRRCA